jgi:hypothetical protein
MSLVAADGTASSVIDGSSAIGVSGVRSVAEIMTGLSESASCGRTIGDFMGAGVATSTAIGSIAGAAGVETGTASVAITGVAGASAWLAGTATSAGASAAVTFWG